MIPAGPAWEAALENERVVFGAGTLGRLGELARDLGARHALLVTDPGLRGAGHVALAEISLSEAGLGVSVFDTVIENPTSASVDEAAGRAREADGVDLIVGLGGGSAMDTAKGVNFVLTQGGRMEDYRGFGKASRPMLPSIGVPTTAGTGSEAQSYALISHDETHAKMACGDRKAKFRAVILDPALSVTQPEAVTIASGIDAVTHAIESYVTRTRSAESQEPAREAWRRLERSFERVLEAPDDVAARGEMLLGAHLAGIAIERSMLGAAHACANPLTARFGTTHGIAVGLMLPAVMRFNAEVVGPLYDELREASVEAGRGRPAVERFEALWAAADLAQGLGNHGVPRDCLQDLAREAAGQWTAGHNPRPVDERDLLGIYEAAY